MRRPIRYPLAAVVGGVTAALPYVLATLTVWDETRHFEGEWPYLLALVGAPVLGSLVFALIAPVGADRIDWAVGCAFAVAMTVAMAVAWGAHAMDEGRSYGYFSLGWAIGGGMFVLVGALVAMGVGLGLTLLLLRRRAAGRGWAPAPWIIGASLAAAEVVAVGMLVAVYG